MATIEEINEILSGLGMLSEVCLRDISREEKVLLCNKQKLTSIAAEKRKERAKKEQQKAIEILKDRKMETEKVIKIYKKNKYDSMGNKVITIISTPFLHAYLFFLRLVKEKMYLMHQENL